MLLFLFDCVLIRLPVLYCALSILCQMLSLRKQYRIPNGWGDVSVNLNILSQSCKSSTNTTWSFLCRRTQVDILLGHHHLYKLLVVDLTIPINISFTDHFIYFFVCKLLSKICHDVTELSSRDKSITVLVENLESL